MFRFVQITLATSPSGRDATLFGAFGAAGGASLLKLHEGDKSGGWASLAWGVKSGAGPKREKRVRVSARVRKVNSFS